MIEKILTVLAPMDNKVILFVDIMVLLHCIMFVAVVVFFWRETFQSEEDQEINRQKAKEERKKFLDRLAELKD